MATLFTDNFPSIQSREDLENIKTQYPDYDPYYVVNGAIPERKELFENLYSQYKPYADRHFLQEVKTHFHQRTWEMYFACVLLENDLTIQSNNSGPDIKIITDKKPIWIECVAPEKGQGKDKVPDQQLTVVPDGLNAEETRLFFSNNPLTVHEVPIDQILLRLTSSLKDKFSKYQEYIENNIVGKNDIFIIAINGGALNAEDPGFPLIRKCLFSIGDQQVPYRLKNNKIETGAPYYSRREELTKLSGSQVKMNFFENSQHMGISTVIYSQSDVLNALKNNENDFVLVHNPLASNPLAEDVFSFFKQ